MQPFLRQQTFFTFRVESEKMPPNGYMWAFVQIWWCNPTTAALLFQNLWFFGKYSSTPQNENVIWKWTAQMAAKVQYSQASRTRLLCGEGAAGGGLRVWCPIFFALSFFEHMLRRTVITNFTIQLSLDNMAANPSSGDCDLSGFPTCISVIASRPLFTRSRPAGSRADYSQFERAVRH